MDRKSTLLGGLDYPSMRGLEVGALAWPLVTKHEGDIKFVDFMDAESLRYKYRKDPTVNRASIVDVDYLWSGNTGLRNIVGPDVDFNYVIASHVIEHVPDLVTWLNELFGVLDRSGEIRLAVPDRRFTFDFLRQESLVADVIAAWLERRRVPSPRAIVDMLVNFVQLDRYVAWSGTRPDVRRRSLHHVPGLLDMARDAADNGVYHDVHSWVFTPASFCGLMADLVQLGALNAECTSFHDTAKDEFEFFVGLRRATDPELASASWVEAGRKVAEAPWDRETAGITTLATEMQTLANQLAAANRDGDRLAARLKACADELAAMRASTSWQVTAPLRRVKTMLSR